MEWNKDEVNLKPLKHYSYHVAGTAQVYELFSSNLSSLDVSMNKSGNIPKNMLFLKHFSLY